MPASLTRSCSLAHMSALFESTIYARMCILNGGFDKSDAARRLIQQRSV